MSQTICVSRNGEQVEVATRTMVAAAIVSSTAIYLIYKKKLIQRDGYNGYNMCLPILSSKFWKNKMFWIFIIFIIIFCAVFLKSSELLGVGISNVSAIEKRKQENLKKHDCPDPNVHPLRHNPLYHPQPFPRYYGR